MTDARRRRTAQPEQDAMRDTDYFRSLTTTDLARGFNVWASLDEDKRDYMRDRVAAATLLQLQLLNRQVRDAGHAIVAQLRDLSEIGETATTLLDGMLPPEDDAALAGEDDGGPIPPPGPRTAGAFDDFDGAPDMDDAAFDNLPIEPADDADDAGTELPTGAGAIPEDETGMGDDSQEPPKPAPRRRRR